MTKLQRVSFRSLPSIALILLFAISNAEIASSKQAADEQLPEVVTFNAHIRPLMSNTCFVCHGPAGEENPSELRLDSFDAATSEVPSGEGQAIKPGDAMGSVVYQRIVSDDPDEQMPPPGFRHQLSSREKAILKRWIEQGAKYQRHWAYAPLDIPEVPVVDEQAKAGGNAIDAFIRSRLGSEGLQPSPEAERATLLRRLSLDLIGLPPTLGELQAFLADESSDAYERQVDRLLASPHYGERMAAPWLDIVRFSDTVGFHGDQNQRIFPYRDYVINAFNNNKPFDEFTREQLAGDLLPNPTVEQLTATGFTRLNMMTREGGAQPKEYLAKYTADRVRAVGTAWMGATLGCCECHDHKYDPFSTKDFYSLGAFFADLRQWGVYSSYGYTPNPDLHGFNNNFPFPPELYARSETLNQRIDYLQRQADEKITAELSPSTATSDPFQQWVAGISELLGSYPDGWVPAEITTIKANKGTKHTLQIDASLLLQGKPQKDEVVTLELTLPWSQSVVALQLEALPDDAHGGHVGRARNGSFRLELEAFVQRGDDNELQPLKVAWAQPNHEAPKKYHNGRPPVYLGQQWQSLPAKWQVPSDGSKLPHTAVYHFAKPISVGPIDGNTDDKLVVKLKSSDVGRVRFAVTPLAEAIPGRSAANERLARAMLQDPNEWRPADFDCVLSAYYRATTPPDQVSRTCKTYRRAIVDCRAGYSHSLIAQTVPEKKVLVSRVLPRGNWQDESGELVEPGVPEFLPQPADSGDRRLTRLDLANWLTAPENPLTARHFVNRMWKQFFGAGLSNKLDDLGNQGEWPSHPLLLDWLAGEFRDSGWDVKHLVKLIVMSQTYKQKAAWRDDLAEIDPYNRLLSQQSARRLSAEGVRDNALAIAGLLSSKLIGGPSVFPYQPRGYYSNIQFPNRSYSNSQDDRQYRRGVYMHWQRTFLHPMLANFDAPARDECTADRVLSNSPQQALTLLNDPSFVEASRAMAERIIRELPDADFSARLERAFAYALSRPSADAEVESLRALYERQHEYFGKDLAEAGKFQQTGNHPAAKDLDPAEVAAWSQVCRVILNLHETITRY